MKTLAAAGESETTTTEHNHLREALVVMLSDEGFKLPSTLAQNAHRCATLLLEWFDEENNTLKADEFCAKLIHLLETCFHTSRSTRIQRERLCEKLFKLRASDEYRELWSNFLAASIHMAACPIFYQAVTDIIMKALTKIKYPVTDTPTQCVTAVPVDRTEKNVLRLHGRVHHSFPEKQVHA